LGLLAKFVVNFSSGFGNAMSARNLIY